MTRLDNLLPLHAPQGKSVPVSNDISPTISQEFNVKRRLGLLSCVAFIVGTIIGSGIFVSPTGVLRNSGSVGLCFIVWIACGVISMACALVYIELASLIPTSGAEHGYYNLVLGSFPAFMFVWVESVVIIPGGSIIKCLTLSEYVSVVLFDGCGPPIFAKKLIAYFALLTITITNCVSVRLAARVQILFTILKTSGLVLIIIGGLVWFAKGHRGSLLSGFDDTTSEPQDIALAFYAGLWAYDGWGHLNMVVEEIVHPRRNIPLAVFISLGLVTIVYLMVNVSYLAVLQKDVFLSTWAVGSAWGEVVLGGAVIIIPLVVASSVYGSSNGSVFNGGRLLFAAGRCGHFPEMFSYVNIDSHIPLPGILLTHFISILMLIPGDIGSLINLLSFLAWFFYGLSMAVVIILRFKMKEADRKIKVPLPIPALVLLVCIYLTIAPFLSNPKLEFLYALAYLVVGAILYFPFVYFKIKVPGCGSIIHAVQLLLNVAPTSGLKSE